ncbi:MAG: flagellar basal body-associated FliL family protein [Candidatus Hatepunaea meridiana]|nr:flagellar basal body-associated FliL family protein [Candidatus Hatepunaea meridiana]
MLERKKQIEESNTENTNEESSEASKGTFGWLKWIIIAFGAMVISVGAFILVKKLLLPKYQTITVENQIAKEDKFMRQKPEMGIVYVFKDLTVNTLGSNGRRFVIVEYVIESRSKKTIDEVKSREPRLRDVFIKYLRRHTANQLLDLEFQEKSKSELIELVNTQLSTGNVDSLYYTKLIIQ